MTHGCIWGGLAGGEDAAVWAFDGAEARSVRDVGSVTY